MCKDIVDAKRRDLRVRADNPAERVHAPERGTRPAKQYLYPSEFASLIGCSGIDRVFRTLYAVAVYTYARSNELAALTWDDVDLAHNVIHITKSIDHATHKVKSTMPDHEDRAVLLRQHLESAGVKRAELFESDAQRKHITFHDLRATGITWAAVRGDDRLRIKQRAGHASFSTTEVYIREAENLRDGFGDVFPGLPPGAHRRSIGPRIGPSRWPTRRFPGESCGATGDRTPTPGCADRRRSSRRRRGSGNARRRQAT